MTTRSSLRLSSSWKPGPVSRAATLIVVLGLLITITTSCTSPAGDAIRTGTHDAGDLPSVRLGYFPNLTHATALVGVRSGALARSVEGVATIDPAVFNAGPSLVEAIFSGSIDIALIGPNPAINAFAKSDGQALRIIAGATSGGAALVVRDGIDHPSDLRGKTLATPQLGSTQDIAARAWLRRQGLATDVTSGGEVSIVPQPNSQIFDAFRNGQIDGAWVPEPWATRLVSEANAKVLVNEADLWPDRRFATTVVVARTEFLEQHPHIVKRLLGELVEIVDRMNDDPVSAQLIANDQILAVTGKRIDQAVLTRAWNNIEFTVDPMRKSVQGATDNAIDVGLLDPVDIGDLFDTRLLDAVTSEGSSHQGSKP